MKFDALCMTVALVISVAVAAVVLPLDFSYAKKLHETRILATIIPAAGTLSGRTVDGSDWAPREGEESPIVLFGLAENGRVGDLSFWLDVAVLSEIVAPEVRFVGLCAGDRECRSFDSSGRLIFLEAMDPLQTHALAAGSKTGLAYIYRGARSDGSLSLHDDRAAFVAMIAGLSQRRKGAEGT